MNYENPQNNRKIILENETLYICQNEKQHKIPLKNILFIKGADDHVIINDGIGTVTFEITLYMLLALLPSDFFYRIHRSYIINMMNFSSKHSNYIFLKRDGGKCISVPIGGSYQSKVQEMLKKHLK